MSHRGYYLNNQLLGWVAGWYWDNETGRQKLAFTQYPNQAQLFNERDVRMYALIEAASYPGQWLLEANSGEWKRSEVGLDLVKIEADTVRGRNKVSVSTVLQTFLIHSDQFRSLGYPLIDMDSGSLEWSLEISQEDVEVALDLVQFLNQSVIPGCWGFSLQPTLAKPQKYILKITIY